MTAPTMLRPQVEPDLAPSAHPTLSATTADEDLVALIPEDIRDVEASINLVEGQIFTPADIEQALIRLSNRMDCGGAYLDAVERAHSKAREVYDKACSTAMDRIVHEYEQQKMRPPAEDIRKARVFLATEREREQLRRIEVLLSQTKRRLHHLSRQVEIARSLGASVRSAMGAQPGWS